MSCTEHEPRDRTWPLSSPRMLAVIVVLCLGTFLCGIPRHVTARWATSEVCDSAKKGSKMAAVWRETRPLWCASSESGLLTGKAFVHLHSDEVDEGARRDVCALEKLPPNGRMSYTRMGAVFERYTCDVSFSRGLVTETRHYLWD